MARPRSTGRADLHIHTTYSDGAYTPAQIIDLARRSGLAALAITDHDTLAGVTAARGLPLGTELEVIAGVEISTAYRSRELHLLAYFVDPLNPALDAALDSLRTGRVHRFREMIERLKQVNVHIEELAATEQQSERAVGRRHLAGLLVKAGKSHSVRGAFTRYLHDGGRVAVPKTLLPVAEAIALVRSAGGVASWAHPSYDCNVESLTELRAWGLSAVEVAGPAIRKSRSLELRTLAQRLSLAVTAGSDCHGPDSPRNALGSVSLSSEELERLRRLACS